MSSSYSKYCLQLAEVTDRPSILPELFNLHIWFDITGWLQVRGSDAPFLLPGRVHLDAVRRGAAVPHGCPGVQCYHSTPLPVCHRLWNTSCYRHYFCHHQTKWIRHWPSVSVWRNGKLHENGLFFCRMEEHKREGRVYLCVSASTFLLCHSNGVSRLHKHTVINLWRKHFVVNLCFLPPKRSCWLSSDLIWSFFGPVCFIIILNVFFFIITVWKLAQKFTSLNPDLSKLHKIKSVCMFMNVCMCNSVGLLL